MFKFMFIWPVSVFDQMLYTVTRDQFLVKCVILNFWKLRVDKQRVICVHGFCDRCVMIELLWLQQQQPHQLCDDDISTEWDQLEPVGHCVR